MQREDPWNESKENDSIQVPYELPALLPEQARFLWTVVGTSLVIKLMHKSTPIVRSIQNS
jgi:hypothetical protein